MQQWREQRQFIYENRDDMVAGGLDGLAGNVSVSILLSSGRHGQRVLSWSLFEV